MNRPFLLYQIDILRKAGIEDITLSLSYQPDKIEQLLGDGSEYGVNLKFLTEPHPLGTAGAYRFASEHLTDTTVVLNGDILTNANLADIVAFHRKNNAEATITLAPVKDPVNYGLVETDKEDRVTRFIEKPTSKGAPRKKISNINAGIYVLEPSVRKLISKDENRSFEYQVFPDLLENDHDFYAYKLTSNYWRDLGTPENYLQAHMDFVAGKIEGFEMPPLDRADIATHSSIENSLVGEGCVIKPNVEIVNSVLAPGVHVEEKARIENSVMWSYSRIGSFASVTGSVIARSCHIGRNTIIREGTVLGDKASIPDYSCV
jgi:NDP-sugar pyrophosphorylase family protein